MPKVISVLLLITGLINFLPVIGVLSSDQINGLYGLEIDNRDLMILLRHRALLFGIIGGFVIYSAFKRQYQLASILMMLVSMLGFLFILHIEGSSNYALAKIALIDVIGIVLALIALMLKLFLSLKFHGQS